MGKLEATGKWEKIRTRKTIRCGEHCQVDMDKVVTPGGKLGVYWVVRNKPFVLMVPQDAEGNLHMVRQHRYPLDQFTTEFPAGGSDGQDPLVVAKRELEEELGLASDDWYRMGKINKGGGISDSVGFVYMVKNVRRLVNPVLDPMDQNMIQRVSFPVGKVREMILSGEIDDAATIAAFCRAEMVGLLK